MTVTAATPATRLAIAVATTASLAMTGCATESTATPPTGAAGPAGPTGRQAAQESPGPSSARLDVVLVDANRRHPTEGGRLLLTVLDSDGQVVAEANPVYPAPVDGSRTLALLTHAQVPAGTLVLRTQLVVCSGSPCPEQLPNEGVLRTDICDERVRVTQGGRQAVRLLVDDAGACTSSSS